MEALKGDVLDIHNEYSSYGEYKAALDGELQKSAESFVRIGYLLKVARDTDILMESGYRNVNEFAEKEYNLDKSQVSRFIRINDKFSENGYSDRLQEQYRSFGYAKLAMMLLLPAEINEELTSGYTKADIQVIKEEIDEEKEVTDLEVMMEEKDERQQACGIFGKVLYQIGKDDPEIYLQIYDAVENTVYDGTSRPVIDKLMDALAPSGEKIISVRVPGEGRKMLSIKGEDKDPVVVDVRSGEKVSCTWDDLIGEIETLCGDEESDRKAWEKLYGEPFPEKKQEVAPVQPKKGQEPRKTGKVTKAKKPEKAKETRAEQVSEPPAETPEQQETVEQQAEEPEMEEQEAAGVGNEESGENEAEGEDVADSKEAGESSADSESGDEEDGAAGGSGEGSSGGGEDGEGLRDEENTLKVQYCELNIKNNLGAIEGCVDKKDWKGVMEKAQEIIEMAQEALKLTEGEA